MYCIRVASGQTAGLRVERREGRRELETLVSFFVFPPLPPSSPFAPTCGQGKRVSD